MKMMMRVWLSCHLLLAGIFLDVFAATPEECQLLVTPLSLADPSVILGKTNFLAGYTNYGAFKSILKATESSWLNITESNITSEVLMSQENRINGTCLGSTVAMTLEGQSAKVAFADMNSVLSVLPSCDGCFVFYINFTATNVKKLLEHINVSDKASADEAQGSSLYLMGKQLTLSPSDLEHFRKQASCLGFMGEPDFLFNPEKKRFYPCLLWSFSLRFPLSRTVIKKLILHTS
uniref:Apolipoprotein M n=1 Tax=Oryzias sinensis TaxID=183150 RepID=A0A8C7ZFL9_9TELE